MVQKHLSTYVFILSFAVEFCSSDPSRLKDLHEIRSPHLTHQFNQFAAGNKQMLTLVGPPSLHFQSSSAIKVYKEQLFTMQCSTSYQKTKSTNSIGKITSTATISGSFHK